MKPRHRLSPIWLPLVACCLLLAACARPPPEQRLRAEIDRMRAALEARQPDEVMRAVSADFSGPGGLDRDMLRRSMELQVLGRARVGITLARLRTALADGGATVRFDALVTGGDDRWLPQEAQLYEVETGWREEQGQWRLVSADWHRAGE